MSLRAAACLAWAALGAVLVLAGQAAAAAEPSWDEIVQAAAREGEVDVHGGPGKLYEQVMTEGFRHAYPAIKINFSGSSGRDAIPKIMREREGGIFSWDVYVGGTPSILQTLKPAGAFAPLRPALILPEVTDDKGWYGGLDHWMDKEQTYVLAFEATVSPVMVVNWDAVAKSDLKSYQDLLRPQFSGKMVWDDPRLPGQGVASAQTLLINFGPDYLTQLYAKQKIVYTANPRQNAEWVVRGQYPIGIATASEELEPFQQQGLGKNIASFDGPLETPTVGPGFGTVSLFDRAPHPNAAKVYINWLLSKAGQADWEKTGHNSRRLDVAHAMPELFPKAGVTYIDDQNEDNIPSREEAANLAKQYIPAGP